jgi:predicted nucleic-acid-binding protein
MIGLDTNILVRYLVQDDPVQSKISQTILEKYSGKKHAFFINNIVVCELIWVLERGYRYSTLEISAVIKQLLLTEEFCFEFLDILWMALNEYEVNGLDFSDALIVKLNKYSYNCAETITFDKKVSRLETAILAEKY